MASNMSDNSKDRSTDQPLQQSVSRCQKALSAVSWRFDVRGAANHLWSYGDRTFAAAGPRLWNSLPVQLCNPDIT